MRSTLMNKLKKLIHGSYYNRSLVGPAELWEMKRAFQVDFLRSVGLEPHHTLLDLDCGNLRGGIPLIQYLEPGHYAGVEKREEVLNRGRREVTSRGLELKCPLLVCTDDLATLELGRRFDCVWAYSVLFHLDDPVLDGAFAFVRKHLRTGGSFYATALLESDPHGPWREFPVIARPLDTYRAAGARHELSTESVGPVTDLGHAPDKVGSRQHMLRFFLTGGIPVVGNSRKDLDNDL